MRTKENVGPVIDSRTHDRTQEARRLAKQLKEAGQNRKTRATDDTGHSGDYD